MTERLVIVGADAAGMSAATGARRLKGSDELSIVAFERGNFTSYTACGIPYFVGGVVTDLDTLVVRTPEEFAKRNAVTAHVRHEVTDIDLDKRIVRVRSDGGRRDEGFDKLMVATGAVPIRPEWDGADAAGVFGVQVLDDGVAVRTWVDKERPRRAVVVGAGYIGLEMAEALKLRGLDVTVVEQAPQPMLTLDEDMGALVADRVRAMGIGLRTGEVVERIEARDDSVSGVLTSEGFLSAEIVVMGLGVRPNTALAEDAGIAIGDSGGIRVDDGMRTSAEGVWSGGDCAEKFHLVSRRPVAIALGTHANKEGRVAGTNIGGGDATFPGVLGTAASKVCEVEVARTGLKESEAVDAGFDVVTVVSDSTTRAGYFPGAEPIKTKLVAQARTGRLLGAQIVGEAGAAKRIDVLATALWNEMTVEDLIDVDLSYAPPFSPVWDPVLMAARKAAERVHESRADSG